MADYNRPPPADYSNVMEIGASQLPPGALVPSIPGYSGNPPSPRANISGHAQHSHRHGAYSHDSYGGGGGGAYGGVHNPGVVGAEPFRGPQPSTLPRAGGGSNPYSMRDMQAAVPVPPVPPPPQRRAVSGRRALPTLPPKPPGVSEAPGGVPPPFHAPPRPVGTGAPNAPTPAGPPQPPLRSSATRRALPTPPGHPAPPVTAPPVPPPLPPPPTYDSSPRQLPDPATYQSGSTLPHPPSQPLPKPPSQQQQRQDLPSRQASIGSSSYPSGISHNTTGDSYFDPDSTAENTSVTSHSSAESYKLPYDIQLLANGNHDRIRPDSPPADEATARPFDYQQSTATPYDAQLLDLPGRPNQRLGAINAEPSATPGGSAAWKPEQHRFLSTSPSVNSLQTEAAPTPPPLVATPSPIPTPPAPAVSYPDARGAAEQAAASIEFPSARPTSRGPSGHPHPVPGRSPYLGRDLYEELDVPESLDGGHDQMQPMPAPHQAAAGSSTQAYLNPVPESSRHSGASTQTPVAGGSSGTLQWAANSDRTWVRNKLLLHEANGGDEFYDEDGNLYDNYASSGEEGEGDEEIYEFNFFNPAYLSEMSVQVRDRVIRGSHVKGGIPWAGSFTGKDVVTIIQTFMPAFTRDGPADRRFALQTAKSLHSQLWLIEVDWESRPLRDSDEDVYKFMSEMEGIGEDLSLPKGVLTMATQCYASSCSGYGGRGCYSPRCPYNTPPNSFLSVVEEEPGPSRPPAATIVIKNETDWEQDVPAAQLAQMDPRERQRQTLIRNAILLEERYEADLATVEEVFITPLETANPPIVEPYGKRDQYVRTIFSNIREIRRSSRALLENFSLHLQQGPLVQTVGDVFLEAATEFRSLYPTYTDNLSKAEALLSQALEEHRPFAQWMFEVSKDRPERRHDLRYLLKRPAMHLQNYPQIIEEILRITPPESPDCDFLKEALKSIQNISYLSRLKLWQASKGRGVHGNLTWKDIVAPAVFESMSPNAQKLQFHIWELIQGEMEYVADLEAIDTLYITPLREADNPIIERARLEVFIDDAFHNYRSILDVHERFLSELHKRQIEQHPKFGMVSDLMYDAALNWNEAYMEYMPHFPIAKAKIDEETAKNPRFAAFLEQAYKSPLNPGRHNIIHFVQRPIPRLVRYNLILSDIIKRIEQVAKENGQDPHDNPDFDQIPLVKDLIDKQAKAGDKGVAVNAAKVELWSLKSSLDGGKFGQRVVKDLDLLNPVRELIHRGKVFRQPEGTISGSWSELTLFLFDNYFVQVKQTKLKNRDAPVRYSINRRPIPLELLSLGDFSQPAQTRSIGVLNKIGGKAGHNEGKEQTQSDSRTVHPFTFSIIGAGLSSGQYTLWTDSEQSRDEWHEKLKHAKVLRAEVDEANKVFEFTPLSLDTFYMAPGYGVHPHANQEYTGRVTCSVPFVTVDRRSLVAVGCEQGVWIGVQHDPPSLRKVLHVKNVTQIAVLEEFGIFLVLADKSLLAYHLEALVPTAQSPQVRSAPQRLSGVRDIVFFVVGQLNGLTLVLYVKRKGMDSVFRVLEPVLSRGAEDRRRGALGGLLGQRSEWFRLYKEFFIPTEALHVHFLKAKIAIVCAKGFEIMGLTDLRGGSIPIFDPQKAREKPALAELARLCEQAKPIAMFRSTESEFLLCYDRFGIYVDRHGEPNRDMQPIEWEGTPENIVFHPPYLLLVSPSFIEVRHIDTAKLLQIYTGVDIRCTWDGTGGMLKRHNDAPGPKGWGEEVTSTEPRLHICKRTDDPKRTKGIGQHVFELTPTLLLNNPLLNPVHTQDPNYFPPAPLDHRTSMSNSSYAGAYPPDSFSSMDNYNQIYSQHRRSLSSASTTTYPYPNANGLGMSSAGGFMPTPSSQQNLLNPLSRRVSDMSTPSTGAGASANSAFDMPTVYQKEVQDYQGDYFSHSQGRAGSRDDYGSPYAQGQLQQPAPPRQASNDWPSQAWEASVSPPPQNGYEFSGGRSGYGQPMTHPQGGYPDYGAQQRQASYEATPPRGANDYAQGSQAPGPNDYAQVSQADEYAAYRYGQRNTQQNQNQGY